MEMTGERRIPAPRQRVWDALNDPEVLKASITGCESLEQTDDGGFAATVTAKVGPVKAKFKGQVTLSDLNPPESYTISGEGKGGAAGFAKGGADVHLAEDGDETVLTYKVNATVGGKLAQIGSRLIDGVAAKMADDFFGKFSDLVAAAPAVEATPAEAPAPEAPPPAEPTPPPADAAPPAPEAPAPEAPRPEAEAAPQPPREELPQVQPYRGVPTWAWAAALVVVIVLLLMFYGS